MIDLKPEHLDEVKRILYQYFPSSEVRLYGSRTKGKARKDSDIDLVLVDKEKIDWRKLEAAKDAFSLSNLPFKVDILDWQSISESFKNVILSNYEIIQTSKAE